MSSLSVGSASSAAAPLAMNIDIDTIVGKLTKADIRGHDKASIEERFPAPLTGQIRWLVCMRLYGTSEQHVQKVLDEYGKSLWVRDDVNKRKQDIVLFSLCSTTIVC